MSLTPLAVTNLKICPSVTTGIWERRVLGSGDPVSDISHLDLGRGAGMIDLAISGSHPV